MPKIHGYNGPILQWNDLPLKSRVRLRVSRVMRALHIPRRIQTWIVPPIKVDDLNADTLRGFSLRADGISIGYEQGTPVLRWGQMPAPKRTPFTNGEGFIIALIAFAALCGTLGGVGTALVLRWLGRMFTVTK